MLNRYYAPTLDHVQPTELCMRVLWIHNNSRFHLNMKVITLFFMGHAPILA